MEPLSASSDASHLSSVYKYVINVYQTVSGTVGSLAEANKYYISATLKGLDLYTQVPQLLMDLKHASKYYYYSVQFQNHLIDMKKADSICNFKDFVDVTNELGEFIVQLAVCSSDYTVKVNNLPEDIVEALKEFKTEYINNKNTLKHVVDCGLVYATALNTDWYRNELSRIINRLNIHLDIITMELEYEFAGKKCLTSGKKQKKAK